MLSFSLTFLLASCSEYIKPSFVKSKFYQPGEDVVENEFVDAFQILEDNLPHPKLKPISEANYTDYIDPNDYPWPGHEYNTTTCSVEKLSQENKRVNDVSYLVNHMKEEDLYWHPAAAAQYYITNEEMAKMPRVKAKLIISDRYQAHYSPFFVPPGEIVTIEIPQEAAGKMSVIFNPQTFSMTIESPESNQRYPSLKITVDLKDANNTIGYAMGGILKIKSHVSFPVEMIISGVIVCPRFILGHTTDDEWEKVISKYPGPLAYFDTGNIVGIFPSYLIRDSSRMNDNLFFYRSAYEISQSAANDRYSGNEGPRILNPLMCNFDSWVPVGAAAAYVGGNYIQFESSWVTSMTTWDYIQQNPWGIVHEMNHHHQSGWGLNWYPEQPEMTNNALNLLIYSRTNAASAARTEEGGLTIWDQYVSPYQKLNISDTDYGLPFYSNMIHFFGPRLFTQFVRDSQQQLHYSNEKNGIQGAELLRASRVFRRNMRYHFNFHKISDEKILEKDPTIFEQLESFNFQYFHPVTNAYACGLIHEGERVITARPFRIPPFTNIIDFVKTMRHRPDTKLFGDFVYSDAHFEKGREKFWVPIEGSPGRFQHIPKESIQEIEEVIVDYFDLTTNETTHVICQFQVSPKFCTKKVYHYDASKIKTVYDAYNDHLTATPTEVKYEEGLFYANEKYYQQHWYAIVEGKFSPAETGKYIFSLRADDAALFYISEEKLFGDTNHDLKSLINEQSKYSGSYSEGNNSKPIFLMQRNYIFLNL